VWIMLCDIVIPQLREIVRTWPLILVSLGSAILLIVLRRNQFNSLAASGSGRKENNAN